MNGEDISSLKDELEQSADFVPALAARISFLLGGDDTLSGRLLVSTEEAIRVVGDHYPGWAITLDGYANPRSNSSWKCTFRELRGPDDDQIVGIGTAATMRLALMAAIAHIHLMRVQGYV